MINNNKWGYNNNINYNNNVNNDKTTTATMLTTTTTTNEPQYNWAVNLVFKSCVKTDQSISMDVLSFKQKKRVSELYNQIDVSRFRISHS